MKNLVYLLLAVSVIVGVSCKKNPHKVKLGGHEKDVEIVEFGDEFFAAGYSDTSAILELRNKYPDFFDLFTYRVIQIGGLGEEQFFEGVKQFQTDTMILSIRKNVEQEFSDFSKIETGLKNAFKYYQFHFPDNELPVIYTYISGFNQSVVTANKIIGISLDKYLGREFEFYQHLNATPTYKILNMHKGKIVSDVAYAWGITEFDETAKTVNLLDNMIYQGKIMYFVDALLPDEHDSVKIGYTEKQLEWCKMNEAKMWSTLIENKMLYSTNRMDIVRYINPAPSTSGFPIESPGRTGVWIGWQIVRQYMKKHPETTLEQLMKNSDFQKILNDSKYFPD
jgi:gliding motility-associated lipoprotein GldB